MAKELVFLDFDGLDDHQEEELLMYIYPSVKNPLVELPWEEELFEEEAISTGNVFSLNVHAPSFQSKNLNLYDYHKVDTVDPVCHKSNPLKVEMTPIKTSGNDASGRDSNFSQLNEKNISNVYRKETESVCDMADANGNSIDEPCAPQSAVLNHTIASSTVSNGTVVNQLTSSSVVLSSMSVHPRAPFPHSSRTSAGFKMCPTVSSFVPQNIPGFASNQPSTGLNNSKLVDTKSNFDSTEKNVDTNLVSECDCVLNSDQKRDGSPVCASSAVDYIEESSNSTEVDLPDAVKEEKNQSNHVPQTVMPRSFADVLKSKSDEKTCKISAIGKIHADKKNQSLHNENCSLCKCNMKNDAIEDKSAHTLGKYFYDLQLDFSPVLLQPRGLINCRNWCYVNATLQALLACPPFYRLLRSLPKVPLVNRGRSSTPVIDSMVSLAHEFVIIPKSQEDLNPGTPIQPNTVYEMLGALKSDCLKGQQEDAEEFLSYILNGMHEEMVLLIKNFEKKNNLLKDDGAKVNGHFETNEDEEWQVIGAKQRGMITRKVIEHKTPISDLLGGQIKSCLTTNGKASASASVQPFFTLPLDIQAENVNSVEEALNQMTVKEPVQGYTCAKTKQEVEAFSKILLQKLPPILILHLKRFVYNKKGGCKKVMKHTEYPISLELKKDLFSPEAKKAKKPSTYKLFAVMYHNGEDATTGHYISDIYHHGSNNWIRCDDRNVTSITEIQVLSHSPPRVPYLLFYQVNDPTNESSA